MTIDKAIRVNNDTLGMWNSVMDTESKEAIKLGIEALKLYKTIKADGLRAEDFLLPGETKD